MSKFKKAEKKKSKLRLGITGPSGSGKTYSSLRLAKGLGGKITVIDTEKGSASLYADKFEFDVLELTPPYSPERYIDAMNDAVKEGYDIIIMDSISHAWAGEGGILNTKEKMDARGGNSFANWAKMTPVQERFIAALINCPAHLIVTMRSKQDHVQINEGGKTKIQKVGMAPIQRDGFEYELTTVFDIAINHEAETSKDRTGIFTDRIFKITEETGITLREWLDSGSETIEEKKEILETIDTKQVFKQAQDKCNEPIKVTKNPLTNELEIKEETKCILKPMQAINPNDSEIATTKEPERFPKKEQLTIDKNQAEFLFTTGYKFGYKKDEIIHLVYQMTKKVRLSEVNNSEFETILQHMADNRKVN